MSIHIEAEQQTPLLQAPCPLHATWQTEAGDLQTIGASHAEGPSQWTSHEDAAHSRPPPQALGARHSIAQCEPAHLTLPPQLDGLLHRIEHSLAPVQSMPPGHAEGLLHSTRQASPSGHVMSPVHRLPLEQSNTHTEPMHCPPRIAQRASQGGATLASAIAPPPPPRPPPPLVPASRELAPPTFVPPTPA